MSTNASDDLDTTGYFLPEDTQLRLKQLGEYVMFLSNLARPRRPDEANEWYSEIRPGEVAICLELLAEQVQWVLGELSYPAERREGAAAPETAADAGSDDTADTDAAYASGAPDDAGSQPAIALKNEAGERYVAGVTLDQLDELVRLGDILRAHGDAVTATDQADFADVTRSIMGDAIIRDAERVRDLLRDIDGGQRLNDLPHSRGEVQEKAASYRVATACWAPSELPRPWPRLVDVLPGGGRRTPAVACARLAARGNVDATEALLR